MTFEEDRSGVIRRQYETIFKSVVENHQNFNDQVLKTRDAVSVKMGELVDRCTKLETAFLESTKEVLKERNEKQKLQVRMEEMQTGIEQRIQGLRKQIEFGQGSTDDSERLKVENAELRTRLLEMKVVFVQMCFAYLESLCCPDVCCQ
jgi:hypothetical protein